MFELPDALPVVRRTVARVVVVDADGRILLLHTRDPTCAELGTWWELPGGGVEPGETLEEAASRELYEETSIWVDPRAIRPIARWHRHASFRYRGTRHLQCETLITVELSASAPEIDGSRRVDFEDEDYFGSAWWTPASIGASRDRFYPGRLPELLPRHLAGDHIEEPFEIWS